MLGTNWAAREVSFAHPAAGDTSVHRAVFGPKVHFGADADAIVCEARDLDARNPIADAAMAQHARQYVESLPPLQSPSIAHAVRRCIAVLLPRGHGSLEHVARALGTNPRALQRRLDADGESFSELLNATRRELALRHLDNDQYPLRQVGELLGFGFPSSFTRWFVSEFGRSPSEWRASRPRKHAPG
jgi:AraC-like DNA-binding protein